VAIGGEICQDRRMNPAKLDRIDRRILELLQADARLTNQDIAERVNLSPSPCLRRIKRLESEGVIQRYVALVDPASVGLGLLAYVNVRLDKHNARSGKTPLEVFRAAVQAWPEVVACYALTGEMDYLLRVQVEDLDHFSRFVMDTLLKHPSVLDVRSSFALDRIKETTALPLTLA
jgi:Lrp/AsnC family leucine-responsive transcriptional regulator